MSPCPSYSLICHSAVLILKCKCDHVTSKIEILKLPPTTLRILFLFVQFYLSCSHTYSAIRNCSQIHQFCLALLCAHAFDNALQRRWAFIYRFTAISAPLGNSFLSLSSTPLPNSMKYLFNLCSEYPVVTSIIAFITQNCNFVFHSIFSISSKTSMRVVSLSSVLHNAWHRISAQ